MAEYIEREAAIKIVNTPNYNKHDMLFALKTIPAASAADVVKVRHGNWIHREDFDYVDNKNAKHWHGMCDQCGFIHDFLDCHTGQYNYCPHCGAKMDGKEKEDG